MIFALPFEMRELTSEELASLDPRLVDLIVRGR
jgi:hypothetical protein